VPSSCGDRGWEWPGVAQSLRPLALGLALGIPPPETAEWISNGQRWMVAYVGYVGGVLAPSV
jgi:hypothetical protein